jgi:hypothetical protein
LLISRIVRSAVAAVVLMAAFRQPTPFLIMAIVGSAYVVWRHQANIRRLVAVAEPRIGQSVARVDTYGYRAIPDRPGELDIVKEEVSGAFLPRMRPVEPHATWLVISTGNVFRHRGEHVGTVPLTEMLNAG